MTEDDSCSNSLFQRGIFCPQSCKVCGLGPCKRGLAVRTPAEVADDRAAMTLSMVERVARAIIQKQHGGHVVLSPDGPWRDFEMDTARAAIEAMREPTEEMIASAILAHSIAAGFGEDWETQMGDAYRAMIDAALNEQVS